MKKEQNNYIKISRENLNYKNISSLLQNFPTKIGKVNFIISLLFKRMDFFIYFKSFDCTIEELKKYNKIENDILDNIKFNILNDFYSEEQKLKIEDLFCFFEIKKYDKNIKRLKERIFFSLLQMYLFIIN